MHNPHRKLIASGLALLSVSLACMTSAWSAKPLNLLHQPFSVLQSLTPANSLSAQSAFKQISSDVDFTHTAHIRIQQMVAGYPVWGGDAVIHVKNGSSIHGVKAMQLAMQAPGNTSTTMDGVVYQDLAADLVGTPAYLFTAAQADKALQQAVQLYQQKTGDKTIATDTKSTLMVYVDKNNKAHWAFLVSFDVKPMHGMRQKPIYILDAIKLDNYKNWDNLQTIAEEELVNAPGGGFGGNLKMGKQIYDGIKKDFPVLDIERNSKTSLCSLQNDDVTVRNVQDGDNVVHYKCVMANTQHGMVYWDGSQDEVNGGYSPGNDALYAGKVIKDMYQKWYNTPVLVKNGAPMMLNMRVHEYEPDGSPMDNAYWDGKQMTFGDGGTMFYPLVSLGVAAHEISHGFTEQHSGLDYSGQSGGMNEAFSDMAAQAAEFYSTGKNSWEIGPEIFKKKHAALRYMADPKKDGSSIDNAKNYNDYLDVHYSSGVYNKAYYLLGTTKGWDARKAFDVMEKANANYWTSSSNFVDAACGVMKATHDYGYDLAAVTAAFAGVGIDTSSCLKPVPTPATAV